MQLITKLTFIMNKKCIVVELVYSLMKIILLNRDKEYLTSYMMNIVCIEGNCYFSTLCLFLLIMSHYGILLGSCAS